MALAVMMDFAGSGVNVSATFLIAFWGACLLLVGLGFYFTLTKNPDEWYIDEHWGDASIDDDWALALADAKRSTQRKLTVLADRDSARHVGRPTA